MVSVIIGITKLSDSLQKKNNIITSQPNITTKYGVFRVNLPYPVGNYNNNLTIYILPSKIHIIS